MMESCKEEYTAVLECMRANKSNFAACAEVQKTLEECAVKNYLGELAAFKK